MKDKMKRKFGSGDRLNCEVEVLKLGTKVRYDALSWLENSFSKDYRKRFWNDAFSSSELGVKMWKSAVGLMGLPIYTIQ